ncbi:MAG: hypothetical protein QOH49_1522 [Acidobacteriota bacterium]|jgi:hypothetical protein|nr:hypothetical protein [Acidobacteriota bacterium]
MKYIPRLTLICKHAVLAALLLLVAAPATTAQTETFEPFILRAEQTAVRVWTSGDHTFARVNLTFNDGSYRVTSVGAVTRQGNDVSVDFVIDRWTGASTQAVVLKEYFFDLGALPAEGGTFTFTVKSRGNNVRGVTFDPSQIVEHWEDASLARNNVLFTVWTVGGVTFTGVELSFPDESYRVVEWKAPERAGNDFVTGVKLERFTGRASTLVVRRDKRIFALGTLPPNETFTVSVEFPDGVRHSTVPFTPAGTARPASMHPLDDAAFFVRQQYVDFLGREPDPEGLTFWTGDINTNCPFFPSPCADVKRTNVSAAFFLSIESQQTGFYVYRMHKAATGQMPRMAEFMADTRRAAEGVVVGRPNWEALVEENQRRFAEEFVARADFKARYPETLTPAQYVDALDRMIAHPWNENEGSALTVSDREQLIQGLASGTETRASVLRKMALNPDFSKQEFNHAFVLMEYFGYLRRNPNEGRDVDWEGYNYWLGKLNTFGGNYINAEMVKAFLDSTEYRGRFGAQ